MAHETGPLKTGSVDAGASPSSSPGGRSSRAEHGPLEESANSPGPQPGDCGFKPRTDHASRVPSQRVTSPACKDAGLCERERMPPALTRGPVTREDGHPIRRPRNTIRTAGG